MELKLDKGYLLSVSFRLLPSDGLFMSWVTNEYTGFLPGIFSGGGGKIYCYANFYRYANFCIIFGPNFRGGKSLVGWGRPPYPPPPVEESQYARTLSQFSVHFYRVHTIAVVISYE